MNAMGWPRSVPHGCRDDTGTLMVTDNTRTFAISMLSMSVSGFSPYLS